VATGRDVPRAVFRRRTRVTVARAGWDALKAVAVDYYYFLALIVFFIVVWPMLIACHHIDRRCGTQATERLVRFCERF
jgi:hypothetical protein